MGSTFLCTASREGKSVEHSVVLLSWFMATLWGEHVLLSWPLSKHMATSKGKRHRGNHLVLAWAPGLGARSWTSCRTWDLGNTAGFRQCWSPGCAKGYCPINFYAQTSERGTINREWCILKTTTKWFCLVYKKTLASSWCVHSLHAH